MTKKELNSIINKLETERSIKFKFMKPMFKRAKNYLDLMGRVHLKKKYLIVARVDESGYYAEAIVYSTVKNKVVFTSRPAYIGSELITALYQCESFLM